MNVRNFTVFVTEFQNAGIKMNYVEIYKTVLDFHRKHSNIMDTDEFWEELIEESGRISKQYEDAKFIRDLLLAVINELERKAKEMVKNADTAV